MSSVITFLLNQTVCQLNDIDPNTTVLQYLRDHLQRTGSKEGCASGDCGACTVVVAEVFGNELQYKSINSCITPVASLHGKQLITVEDLKQGNQLHPVQQALVDCHGSQCGYCTPGFVMSMFAYRKNNAQPARETIIEALGGNLCRCTGYRPILDAAIKMYELPQQDAFELSVASVVKKLKLIKQQISAELIAKGKKFFIPNSLSELSSILQKYPQARLVAGGTDLMLDVTQGLNDIEVLVLTTQVDELKIIEVTEAEIEIGAAVTYSEARQTLLEYFPDLHELIDRLGSRQIRNQGTLGGNIGNASPIGDMPPALIALGARLLLRKGNTMRLLPLDEYFVSYKKTALQNAEFIERIIIPISIPISGPISGPISSSVSSSRESNQLRVYKISKRFEDDISATCGAFNMQLNDGVVENIRIAFGGMAEIAKRATHCEQALINQPWNKKTIDNAMLELANDFTPLSDFRASANYRLTVSQNLLMRFYLESTSSVNQLRVKDYV